MDTQEPHEGASEGQPEGNTDGSGGSSRPFKVVDTQAELDAIIDKRVAGVERRYSDYDAIAARVAEGEALEAATLAERDTLKREHQALTTALADERHKAMRDAVGREYGIPGRCLVGADVEALRSSAEALLTWKDLPAAQGDPAPSKPPPRARPGQGHNRKRRTSGW